MADYCGFPFADCLATGQITNHRILCRNIACYLSIRRLDGYVPIL